MPDRSLGSVRVSFSAVPERDRDATLARVRTTEDIHQPPGRLEEAPGSWTERLAARASGGSRGLSLAWPARSPDFCFPEFTKHLRIFASEECESVPHFTGSLSFALLYSRLEERRRTSVGRVRHLRRQLWASGPRPHATINSPAPGLRVSFPGRFGEVGSSLVLLWWLRATSEGGDMGGGPGTLLVFVQPPAGRYFGVLLGEGVAALD